MGVLVTAIGSMSADRVLRALRACGAGPLVGCDIHPAAWLPSSPLVDRFHQTPWQTDPARCAEQLLALCVREGVNRIVALTDPEVDALAPHHEAFARAGVVACVPSAATVDLCRDKQALHDRFACTNADTDGLIDTDTDTDPDPDPDPDPDSDAVRAIPTAILGAQDAPFFEGPFAAFPLLVKPRRGRSSQGQFQVRNAADLDYARQRFGGGDHVVQPWLDGAVFVVDVVRQARTGTTVCMAREELLRTANGAGMSVRLVSHPPLRAAAARVAVAVGLHGCANFEFLHHGGRYWLMDANPRFSAGVAFSAWGGYDMVAAHMACFDGRDIAPAPLRPATGVVTRRLVEVAGHAGSAGPEPANPIFGDFMP